jgi:hypothetical protein
MNATEYLVAVAYASALAGVTIWAALIARRLLLAGWQGAPARLAESVLGITALVVAAELAGLFGAFTRWGILIALTVLAAGLAWLKRRRPQPLAGTPPPHPPVDRWVFALAIGISALVALHWSSGAQDSFAHGIYRQDSTWYHLPFAAGFVQSGSTWAINFTDPLALVPWFYPQNSELLHGVGMLVTGNDFLSPLLNLAWMALVLLAGWCIGRPYASAAATAIATALVLDTGMLATQAGNAPSDTACLFFFLACVAILVNGNAARAQLGESRGALFVAGLAAGLAIGTKITMLAPVAALTVALVAIAPRQLRVRSLAAWTPGVLIAGGFWYLRNAWQAGNPLPWIKAGPLPGPDQLSLYPRTPHSVAGYATDPGVWSSQFAPALGRALGELWPLILLGAAAGLIFALLRQRSLWQALGVAGLIVVLTYAFIPVSASGVEGLPTGFETNLRYLAPALVLGLALLPLASPRPVARWMLAALGGAFFANALASGTLATGRVPSGLLYALALVLLPVAIVQIWRSGRGVATAAPVAIAGLALVVLLGYGGQRDYLQHRYVASLAPPADNPGFRATPQWDAVQEWARQITGSRVGIVGPPAAFGQYVFLGTNLSNRVRYIGERIPHGGYLPAEDCVDWRQAVNEGDYSYVVVTPASAVGLGPVPQESLWTESDPAAREILRSGPASVFKIEGDLDPAGCDPDSLPPILRVPGGGFGVPGTIPGSAAGTR